MAENDPDFETLSAYVDGELDAASAASLAALAARDPRIAAKLAKLHRLRAEVSALGGGIVMAANVGPRRGGRFVDVARRPAVAVAACFAILLCAVLLWVVASETRREEGSLVAALIETHDDWLSTGHGQLAPIELGDSPRSVLLAAAGLIQVHHASTLSVDGVRLGHFGYVGANGCRLSLFELPARKDDTVADNLWASVNSGLRLADWTSASTHFIVVARDMNDRRFEIVVDALRQATREDDTTREMIARVESARQPCLS